MDISFYHIASHSCFFLFRIIIYKSVRSMSNKTASGNLCLTLLLSMLYIFFLYVRVLCIIAL
jgi:hypothetical protein